MRASLPANSASATLIRASTLQKCAKIQSSREWHPVLVAQDAMLLIMRVPKPPPLPFAEPPSNGQRRPFAFAFLSKTRVHLEKKNALALGSYHID